MIKLLTSEPILITEQKGGESICEDFTIFQPWNERSNSWYILVTSSVFQLFCLVFTTECEIELRYWWTGCLEEITANHHLT